LQCCPKIWGLATGLLPAGPQSCRYCFTQWSKNRFFALQGRHVASTNMKFGVGERTSAKFHIYRGRNVGIQPPKLSKFRILAINLPLRGQLFAQLLRNSQILYASLGVDFKFLIWLLSGTNNQVISIFPWWGHFPSNFQ